MTAREQLLSILARLHAELRDAKIKAVEEGDCWTGVTCDMVSQALYDAAQAAETERRMRGGK